jgi:soluble lytic murein transglycosylase-like protein
MRFSSPFYVLVALGVAFGSGRARAGEIYKFVEQDGTIVYTNVMPKGTKAKRVRGDFHPPPAKTQPAAVTARTRTSLAEFDLMIEEAALRYRVPVNLVKAVMHAESGFDRMAVSHVGASGLMQLMPATAREMYVKDIFDVKDNIEGGVRYLRVLANEFNGDMVKIVAAYNAGPEAVKKYGGAVPPYEETQAYVRKVLSLYFQYKARSELAQQQRDAQRD